MLKECISNQLQDILKELGVEDTSIMLDVPQDISHGDYTTNIALQLSKPLKQSPMDIADKIASKFGKNKATEIEKIEVVKPGFINFWIAKEELGRGAVDLLNNTEKIYASIKTKNSKLEIYENTGPNTNKPLHIGHLRNIAIGVSLVNLRKAIGHNALSENINNDRGIHIIKAMWAYLEFGRNKLSSVKEAKEFIFPENLDQWTDLLRQWFSTNIAWYRPNQLNKKSDHLLGIFYMLGDRAEKEKPESITQMKEMLLAWEDGETHVRLLWEMMNGWFYEGFRQTHARFLGILPSDQQYDKEWYESELYQAGRQLILDNIDKGVFYRREDNVIMADLQKYNLPDKVVIRSDGSSLYITFDLEEAKQMALSDKADLIAHVVAIEQELYFKQVFAIVDALEIAPIEHFLHIGYGMVNLASGAKMSSREGTVILADELIDQVKEKLKTLFNDMSDDTADKVAVGAIKYMMLKYNPKAAINFDIDSSISLEGNSGPYIQYAYARTQSILRKAQATIVVPTVVDATGNRPSTLGRSSASEIKKTSYLFNGADAKKFLDSTRNVKVTLEPEELDLLRMLYHFPETVGKAAENYSPNLICEYLFELTKKFNIFYQKYRVLDVPDDQTRQLRLTLTAAVGEIIKEGLRLLSIAAPEKM